MKDSAEDLDHLFELWGEEEAKREAPEEHPPLETLTAYQADDLSPEEDEKLQEHLAACPECTTLLLHLHLPTFLEPPEAPSGVLDFGGEAGWRKLREELPRADPVDRAGSEANPRGFLASLRAGYGLAALFALAAVGLGTYSVVLRQDVQEERQAPLVNPSWATLEAGGTRRSPGRALSEVPDVRLPAILALRSPDRVPRTGYRVEFLDSEGRVVRSANASGSEDPSEVLVVLGEQFLDPGLYSVRLLGSRDGQETEIGRYTFRIADH